MINIVLPNEVKCILDKLNINGYEAFVVGGCVRDSLMKKEPNDWDITTSAKTDIIIKLFVHTVPTGLKHGTVTVVINDSHFEITTYRHLLDEVDNIDDESQSLIDDLRKRDFTINAMAYNIKLGLIDEFGGQIDIEKKVIRCVENANDRFKEDPLRMLRAIRFSAQYGFTIEDFTINSIMENNHLLLNVSKERIRDEFNKILQYESIKVNELINTGLMKAIIPEFLDTIGVEQDNPYHIYSISKHIIESMVCVENDLILKITMLLHDIGKPICKTVDEKGIGHFYGHPNVSSKMAVEILKRLKYDNCTIDKVKQLILYHDAKIQDNKKSIRKWLSKLGKENFIYMLKVKEADMRAQNPECFQIRYEKLERISTLFNEVVKQNECFSIKDLAIDGSDLIGIGYSQGKEIGEILNKLLDKVIENPMLNTRDNLLELVDYLDN